jgi:hypothetical protein
VLRLGRCTFEVLTEKGCFQGLGVITIDGLAVRSGRLPLRPFTQSFTGQELADLELAAIEQKPEEIRVRLRAVFRPLEVWVMRDHSLDPIHSTTDWDRPAAGEGRLDLVLRPAADRFGGVVFGGFAYHYEYESRTVPLFYLLDKASWEIGGDISGATVYSQSSCSAPVAVFDKQNEWSTEGAFWWSGDANENRVMTHNLPRWASHQAFDFQFKGPATLLGVYERVGLIRSVLRRDPGRAELKTFDKHIFDQALRHATPPKKILLNRQPKTATDQKNLWTWTIQEVHDRARAEFGLREEPLLMRVGQNYWVNFTIDTYLKDLLPAAAAIGVEALFVDNLNRSDMTELSGQGPGNMCCGQRYETAPLLGGPPKLKDFVARAKAAGIRPFSWTNNTQSVRSPLNDDKHGDWFVKMEDTRTRWGGSYVWVLNAMDFGREPPRRYWIDCMKKIKAESGLDCYLFDSFYNLGFMPVSYAGCTPTTTWRGLLSAFKELQDADIHFMIESFGPFGEVQHGCPTSYNLENLFACYKICLGTGYTTIPSGHEEPRSRPWPLPQYYRILASMANPGHPLFYPGDRAGEQIRIDKLLGDGHKRALADYRNNRRQMCRRYLQEDDQSILWHDAAGRRATLWNFVERQAALPGTVRDVTTGKDLPAAAAYRLQACHTYAISGADPLPTTVGRQVETP